MFVSSEVSGKGVQRRGRSEVKLRGGREGIETTRIEGKREIKIRIKR